MKPYQMSIRAVLDAYATSSSVGLSQIEVHRRLDAYGYNELPKVKRPLWIWVFIAQFQNPLVYILVIAAVIIFFVGDDSRDAFIISGVLFFNAIIGALQEERTADILESLKQLVETKSVIIRDQKKQIVDDTLLVVGDLIVLKEGEMVPADIRVIEAEQLIIDQSLLTGESAPVQKDTEAIMDDVPIMDRTNMVYKGTCILRGTGKGIVVATGMHTHIGQVHTVVEDINTEVPLKKDVEYLAYTILLGAVVLCLLLFILGYFIGKPLHELLVMLTALFICIVPEGLPVVLTLVLVSGVYRMAKQHILVKDMQAVETLGRTDVIIIDKTGTLTRNEMMVGYIYVDNIMHELSGQGYYSTGSLSVAGNIIMPQEISSALRSIGQACYLLNSAEVHYIAERKLFSIKGDPTEAAMYVFAQKIGMTEALHAAYVKIYEIPFDSVYAYHAAFFQYGQELYIYLLGAPEAVFALSSNHPSNQMQHALSTLLEQGLRVVACAEKKISITQIPTKNAQSDAWKSLVTDMHLLGVLAIEDAIRSDVHIAIAQARNAGLSLIMATGDHEKTALYVAKKVGIFGVGDTTLDGARMVQMSDDQLIDASKDITVYYRVSPFDKLRIVNILHKRSLIVAMTGDGINDAPSLVAADLGIAMGCIGTEVAKRAADIVLLDDSFGSIVRAIRQGRHIFYTLKKVILYFFATNAGEVCIILFAMMVELYTGMYIPLPLTAAQILWLNLVTDGFLNVALSMEPEEHNFLQRNWFVHKPSLIDRALVAKVFFFAIPMGAISLYIFLANYHHDLVYARTMTFVAMTMFQWFNAWNCRSDTKSLFQIGFATNKWLLIATLVIILLQIAIMRVPFLTHLFNIVPLSIYDWKFIIACSFPIVIAEEIRKYVVRRIYKVV